LKHEKDTRQMEFAVSDHELLLLFDNKFSDIYNVSIYIMVNILGALKRKSFV
jgi:hypothetical protein